MILHILSNARTVNNNGDIKLLQLLSRADSRHHEKLRGLESPCRENDFFCSLDRIRNQI